MYNIVGMTVFSVSKKANDVDLSKVYPYTKWHHFHKYFNLDAGEEHYKLLAHLANQCPPGSLVVDIGTFVGYSALALANAAHVHVVTYDLYDHFQDKSLQTALGYPNITFKLENCIESLDTLMESPLIILDVDPHDGKQERQIIALLIAKRYKGIVVCDDIYKNDAMREFWNWVPLKKIDITKYGHWSGTGAIVFDETVNDLVVNGSE